MKATGIQGREQTRIGDIRDASLSNSRDHCGMVRWETYGVANCSRWQLHVQLGHRQPQPDILEPSAAITAFSRSVDGLPSACTESAGKHGERSVRRIIRTETTFLAPPCVVVGVRRRAGTATFLLHNT